MKQARANYRRALTALYSHLVAAASRPFSASATAGEYLLTGVSGVDLEQLVAGIPMFGPGIERGTIITDVDPVGHTITLSLAVGENSTGGSFNTGFLTTGRRVKHWTQVTEQPAMFLRRIGVSYSADPQSGFTITTILCEVWIYCNAGEDPDAVPDDALAALEQMLIESFEPDADYGDTFFTLGGQTYWCRIEGQSDISPGDQDGQAIARIPIRITLP